MNSRHLECSFDHLLRESILVCLTEKSGEITFICSTEVLVLVRCNSLLPILFHPCKADNVKALESMCTVSWVPQQDNVMFACNFNELHAVMGGVSIEKEDSCFSFCLLSCQWLEDLLQPSASYITVSPSPFGTCEAVVAMVSP